MCLQVQNKASFHFLTFEFYLHVLNRIVAKISVCFYNYSPHSKPPVLGSSYVRMLHDKPTHCFLIFAKMGVKIFLIELPYGEHMIFNATPDHKSLILLRDFGHAHVHYAA